jgi:hypothetical protein
VTALLDRALATEVSVAGVGKKFGELSADDAATQAAALGAATGFGHRSRVGGVAAAWRELGSRMRDHEVARVSDLDPEEIETLAQKLWVVPPGGSLLP